MNESRAQYGIRLMMPPRGGRVGRGTCYVYSIHFAYRVVPDGLTPPRRPGFPRRHFPRDSSRGEHSRARLYIFTPTLCPLLSIDKLFHASHLGMPPSSW